MPRDGSGIYHRPVGTDAVTDTTIESTKYNGNVADVEQDLNLPRPIVAGGTGATSAAGALANLGGEQAAQVVTNFDSMVWNAGSFYAATSATGAPVSGHAFAGIAYKNDATDWVVEARDVTDSLHKVYYRVQSSGTWGAWTIDGAASVDAAMDAAAVRYDKAQTLTAPQQVQACTNANAVNKAGDTMTGVLTVSMTGPSFTLKKPTSGSPCGLYGYTGNNARWGVFPGNATAETGSNAGSDFNIGRYDDTGLLIDYPFGITRATGVMTTKNIAAADVAATRADGTGVVYFGSGGLASTHYLLWDNAGHYIFQNGSVQTAAKANVFGAAGGTAATGALAPTDANVLGYNLGGGNWAGWGTDGAGNLWLRAGLSGTGPAGFYLGADNRTYINGTAATLYFQNAGVTQSFIQDNGGSFAIYSNAAATTGMFITHGTSSWTAVSDQRFKENVEPIDVLARLGQYRAVSFDMKETGNHEVGVIAQELDVSFPELVDHTNPERLGVAYDRLGAMALGGVKQLLDKIAALEARIEELESHM